jgi:ferritin-like metal-binding protein YciE
MYEFINGASNSDSQIDTIRRLLIFYCLEIFNVKMQVSGYLPSLSRRAFTSDVRQSVLSVNIKATEEIFRLRIILKLLKSKDPEDYEENYISLNFANLNKPLMDAAPSITNDFRMLQHLIVIESYQVQAYQLLRKLARKEHSKNVRHSLTQSLKEANFMKTELAAKMDIFMSEL